MTPPLLDEWLVQRGSKNKHHINKYIKEIELRFKFFSLYQTQTLNTTGRTYLFNQKINNHVPYPTDKHN